MKLTQTLLEWVVTSAALILVVLALRALLGKRVSACLRYTLWAVVLVRLLVPVQLFHLPFAGAVVFPETQLEETLPPVETSASGQSVGSPTIAAPVSDGVAADHSALAAPNAPAVPSAPKAPNMIRTSGWLGWAWLAGSVVVAVVLLACNLRFSRKLRRVRLPLEDADCSLPVYVAVGLPSPCLFGVVRPAVYVTPDVATNPILLRHVLVHEATHFHHGDHCWNVLRNIALAVHWWNPLVWLAVILSRRDCELACDEGALNRLDAGERIAYGRTLLALVTEKPRASDLFTCATTMTGDQKGVIERVTRIARAPKRWLWAAVVAVIAASLACVCAFGAAEETGDGAEPGLAPSIAPLESELNFSIDEDGNVVITGTIDGLTLEAGTCWQSAGAPAHTLMMPYAPFDDDDADGYLQAQWNGDHTVLIWSQIMTTPSSDPNAGFWTFSVDLSRDQAVVTDMASLPSNPAKTDSDMKLHLYPESISDEEAVRAARIAAKLMTVAENYYNTRGSAAEDLYAALPELYAKVLRGESKFVLYKNEPPVSIDEVPAIIDPYDAYMCLQRYAVVDLLGGLGSNEMPNVLAYFCGVAGDMAGYLLLWDEDGQVHGEIFGSQDGRNRWFDELKTDGTFECTDLLGGQFWMSISQLRPTAAGGWTLHSQAVRRGLDSSGNEIDLENFMTIDQELTEQEFEQALEAQRAKPDVTWHGGFPLKGYDGNPVPAQPVVPVDLPSLDGLSFSDGWHNSVNVEGVDVQEMYWYSPGIHYPQGQLFFTNPAFFGPAFAGRQISGDAYWADDSHTQMKGYLSAGDKPLNFTVDMGEGRVSPTFEGFGISDEEMLAMAHTCALLMEQAEAYKTSDAYRPVEDGPLPFDRPMELEFASGAGAWQTNLLLHPDGSFVGDYEDADMTIQYVCQFHGRFGEIRQVTGASWSLTLEELALDTKYPVGTEWDEGIFHYISSNPYGFDKGGGGPLEPGAQFMLYTPDASGYRPTDELYGFNASNTDYNSVMYQFCAWMPSGHRIGLWGPDTRLGCYGLCSLETGCGFFDLKAWGIA